MHFFIKSDKFSLIITTLYHVCEEVNRTGIWNRICAHIQHNVSVTLWLSGVPCCLNFHPEDGGNKVLWNAGILHQYMASQLWTPWPKSSMSWKSWMLQEKSPITNYIIQDLCWAVKSYSDGQETPAGSSQWSQKTTTGTVSRDNLHQSMLSHSISPRSHPCTGPPSSLNPFS